MLPAVTSSVKPITPSDLGKYLVFSPTVRFTFRHRLPPLVMKLSVTETETMSAKSTESSGLSVFSPVSVTVRSGPVAKVYVVLLI